MLLKRILTVINRIIPKSNIILFNSYPAFSDNAWALYEYLISFRPDIVNKYRIIWVQEFKVPSVTLNNSEYIKKKSIKGFWAFLRAKYVFSTHTYSADLKSGNGQIQYNLWHGCGYKSMTEADDCYRGDETIVTSELYRDIHAQVFKMSSEHIHVTGLPRNDILFCKSQARNLLGIDNDSKIYLWMPTYRKATIGHYEMDGDPNSFGVASITDEQFKRINDVMVETNSILVIKPHPMDSLSISRIKGYSNILCVTNDYLRAKGIILYELISEADTLLSDYSSVIIDYLLLDRPVVMVLSDKEEYKDSRGFVFDPVEDYFAGPMINDYETLIDYFLNFRDIDKNWQEKRHNLSKEFHKYIDGNSCERVCDLIWGPRQ